jgi:alkylation response protein AidB-like acyl-CoA dehydrogenase
MPKDDKTDARIGQAAGGEWVSRVAVAGPLVEAGAPEADRLHRLTDEAMAALHGQQLFRMMLPRAHGGAQITLPEFFAALEALAGYDSSAAWCVCQGNGCAMLGAYLPPEVADAIWADDPKAVLAWGPGRAEAVAVDGGYRLMARSTFASGCRHATWLAAHCGTVKEKDGTVRIGADGRPENRTVIFPAGEATFADNWDVVGLRGTGSDSFAVDGLFVPDAFTIVRDAMIEGRHVDGPAYIFSQTSVYAMGFAANALGVARRFLDIFLELAQEKVPRLTRSPIRDNPVVQDEVARMQARLSSGRAFLATEIDKAWAEAEAGGELSMAQRMRIRLAATHAIHEAKAVVDTLFDTAGTSAVFASAPFERRMRDIHAVALQIQGRKTHFQSVGSWMLGHPVDDTASV